VKSLADPHYTGELLARLAQVTPASPRQWGKMTPHQMLCHLSDSFRGVMGERTIADASNVFSRTIMKAVALYAPMPWPHGIPTRPEVDQYIGGTKPAEFARDKADLAHLIESFARPPQDVASYAHPAFGRMSRAQWHRWAYLHVDHHLRQFGA
jgi:hypothetical protein